MNDLAIHRRTVLGALAAATLAPAAGYGQQFPGKPVRLITSFPAGSGPTPCCAFWASG